MCSLAAKSVNSPFLYKLYTDPVGDFKRTGLLLGGCSENTFEGPCPSVSLSSARPQRWLPRLAGLVEKQPPLAGHLKHPQCLAEEM